MNDLEEFESWHEDLMAWERFQDELERIKGENADDDWLDFEDKSLSSRNLHAIRRRTLQQSGEENRCVAHFPNSETHASPRSAMAQMIFTSQSISPKTVLPQTDDGT